MLLSLSSSFFFFFNDTATTEIYTLSLHDALPISAVPSRGRRAGIPRPRGRRRDDRPARGDGSSHRDLLAEHVEVSGAWRSEEHTSELQSPCNLVCRLLLEKKKKKKTTNKVVTHHN